MTPSLDEAKWPYPNFTLDDIDERILANDDISAPPTDAILAATKLARLSLLAQPAGEEVAEVMDALRKMITSPDVSVEHSPALIAARRLLARLSRTLPAPPR